MGGCKLLAARIGGALDVDIVGQILKSWTCRHGSLSVWNIFQTERNSGLGFQTFGCFATFFSCLNEKKQYHMKENIIYLCKIFKKFGTKRTYNQLAD